MSTFGEELIAARKAKHITQEELANAMNVSRSAVSHWESGRNEPDMETLKKLSVLLEHTFSVQVVVSQPADGGISENVVQAETQKTAKAWLSTVRGKVISAVSAVVVIALVVGCIALINNRPAETASDASGVNGDKMVIPVLPPDPGTIEWYSSANEPQEGMPFVMIQFNESPLRGINDANLFPDGPGWIYTTYFTEINGLPFTITNLRLVNFLDIKEDVFEYSGATVGEWFGSSTIEARGQYAFNGGFSMDERIKGIGFLLSGTAEDGTELEFHAYLPLSMEIAE